MLDKRVTVVKWVQKSKKNADVLCKWSSNGFASIFIFIWCNRLMCYDAFSLIEITLTFFVYSSFNNVQLLYSENVVDFTMPFMNLGIGFIYKKRMLLDFNGSKFQLNFSYRNFRLRHYQFCRPNFSVHKLSDRRFFDYNIGSWHHTISTP